MKKTLLASLVVLGVFFSCAYANASGFVQELPVFNSAGHVDTATFSSTMLSYIIGDHESPAGTGCPTFRYHIGSYPNDLGGTAIFLGNCALFSTHDYQYLFDFPQSVDMSAGGSPSDGVYWFSLGTTSDYVFWWPASYSSGSWHPFFGPSIPLIIASSSAFSDLSASSTLALLTARCSTAGNLFAEGLCVAFSFLFVPDANLLTSYNGLASSTAMYAPFSYYWGLRDLYINLAATSSAFVDWSFDTSTWASSTLVHLPASIPILSTTTISTYMSDSARTTFKTLMGLAEYALFALYIYRRLLGIWHHNL